MCYEFFIDDMGVLVSFILSDKEFVFVSDDSVYEIACMNLFFRSNRLISSTEIYSLHQIFHPQIRIWLVLWFYYTSHSVAFHSEI